MRVAILLLLISGCNHEGIPSDGSDGGGVLPDGTTELLDLTMGLPDEHWYDLASFCPSDQPAGFLIPIVARNDTMSDRFVVIGSCATEHCGNVNFQTGTGNCTTFGISDGNGAVPLDLRLTIQCEGPAPPAAVPGGYHRIKPGESFKVGTWGGDRLLTCYRYVDCAQQGWPGGGIIDVMTGYEMPAGNGSYVASIPVENAVPNGCVGGPDDFACMRSGQPGPPQGEMDVCASSATASAPFTLAGGDLVVTIPITQ
jgi:hypothetical protein